MNAPRKKEKTSKSAAKSLSGKGTIAKLTKLGEKPTDLASKALEVFPNPQPKRDFVIHMQIPEFTCLCPKTGQPDFATLILDYIPDQKCVELKSLKLYIWSFREEGAFHEAVTNRILDDFVAVVQPRHVTLESDWGARGGITTIVTVSYDQESD